MKKFTLLFSIPLLAFLFGCPVGIAFGPGNPGTEKLDKDLVGNWITAAEDPEFVTAVVTKESDYSFHVSLGQTGSMFMLEETELTGWNTEVDGQKILYIKSAEQYYMYAYKVGDKSITVYDISLLDGGVDAVTSTAALRKQISTSLKKPECLNDGRLYTKR